MMATIRVRNTNEHITNQEAVRQFLTSNDIYYDAWDLSSIPVHLKDQFVLSDEQKTELLDSLKVQIEGLASERGYVMWDLISLSDATPGLDDLLKKFEQVHTHTEDEVRAIAAGSGTFIIKGHEDVGYFDVLLQPGDVISVPENNPHFFTLTAERKVVAVRLFVDAAGWVAQPFADPAFQNA